jgi:transposase
METERIALSQRERDRLGVLHEIRRKQITQIEAARRLKISDRHIRRLLVGLSKRGDRVLLHGLRGRPSNRRLAAPFEQQILRRVRQCYADFGPTLAAEHLAQEGLLVSRETLRKWMVKAPLGEQLRGEKARSHFGRALRELGIEWIPAHSPQAKGRIERLFATLQDRLVKEMRLAGIDSIAAANHFLEMRFLPAWEERFTVAPRRPRNAHRRLDSEQRLEEILSVRVGRQVADDHTVSWDGHRWGVPREEVCAGLRGAQVEIERRLDGSHWLRFRGRYLRLRHCPAPLRPPASPSGLRPAGLAERRTKPKDNIKPKYHVPAHHPWRKPWNRTFLSCEKPDISTLR